MSEDRAAAHKELRRMVDGFKLSQAIMAFTRAGIPDLLADEEKSADELAAATGLDPQSTYRLLRTLAASGVMRELDGRRFRLAPLGESLRSDVEGSATRWVLYMASEDNWRNWGVLLDSVRTGETAFQVLHGVDAWHYRQAHPELQGLFDRAMASGTRIDTSRLLDAYDFGRFQTVVDVGGGLGGFLAALLSRHSSMSGILFDQPQVTATASATLADAGVADRCRIEAGSFFDSVPSGGDLYVVKSVIHDWSDADSQRILATCRRCMPADARLLLIERILEPPNEGLENKLSDLNMLLNPGGTERMANEYAALLAASGLRLERTVRSRGNLDMMEAVPF